MIVHIQERPGVGRLGRHIEHDDRSKAFRTTHARIRSAKHKRHCAPFQQGDLGSCTGNAMVGALMTGPLWHRGRALGEADAVRIYSKATKLDDIPGEYPPEDTGSSGLAVAKAAVSEGLLKEYRHAFGINDALAALSVAPIIIGVNWYDSFDRPVGSAAELVIEGGQENVRGGHEVVLDAIDVEHGFVHLTNSWGSDWGNKGGAVFSFATLARLLNEYGDATVLH